MFNNHLFNCFDLRTFDSVIIIKQITSRLSFNLYFVLTKS